MLKGKQAVHVFADNTQAEKYQTGWHENGNDERSKAQFGWVTEFLVNEIAHKNQANQKWSKTEPGHKS